jgi:hypothetical protein
MFAIWLTVRISGCHCHIPVAAAHASQIEQQLFPGGNRAHFRQQPMRQDRLTNYAGEREDSPIAAMLSSAVLIL